MQDHSVPIALTTEGVREVIHGHVTASENAVEAGFDGIELHGANGYLIEQFLNPNVNTRTDEYGGNIERRARFAIETARSVASAIGKGKVGIRFSPYNKLGDLQAYPEADVHETYRYLAQEMDKIGIAYIHIALSAQIPQKTLGAIRASFAGTLILCNGMTPETAELALSNGSADLVAFGRSVLVGGHRKRLLCLPAPL